MLTNKPFYVPQDYYLKNLFIDHELINKSQD